MSASDDAKEDRAINGNVIIASIQELCPHSMRDPSWAEEEVFCVSGDEESLFSLSSLSFYPIRLTPPARRCLDYSILQFAAWESEKESESERERERASEQSVAKVEGGEERRAK